jgi:hypothetical protein
MSRLRSSLLATATLAVGTSCGGGSSSGSDTSAPPAAAAATASGKINDNDSSIIVSRGNDTTTNWSYFQNSSEDYQQDEHSSSLIRSGGAVTGAGVVVNFTGTGITWIGKQGPQYGIASYSIDGDTPKTVDNYSSSTKSQNANVTISGLSSESHVLAISLTDKKNSAASGHWQTVDAFDIQGSAMTPSQGTIAGYGSPDLKLTGTWGGGQVADSSDISGGHYWSNETNASISWTFVGSLVEVFGRPDYENGYMDVYIDSSSTPVASVNGHFGMADDDALNSYMLFAKKLPAGTHTIKLVVAGKRDSTARDNYVQIDELLAFQ